jgi:hypothetical protein
MEPVHALTLGFGLGVISVQEFWAPQLLRKKKQFVVIKKKNKKL